MDLMATTEVAAALGVTRQRVLQLATMTKSPLPAPIAKLSCGYIWNGDDIRTYAIARSKRKADREHYERTGQWLYPDDPDCR